MGPAADRAASDAAIEPHAPEPPGIPEAYWTIDARRLAELLHSGPGGLSSEEASRRLAEFGPNALRESRRLSRLTVLASQLRSPLLLLLLFAATASAVTGEWVDGAIVLAIVVASVAVGYSREYSAQQAAATLGARLQARCSVLRDGRATRLRSS